MVLPSVIEASLPRPGNHSKKTQQFIPNPEYAEFWEHWYKTFRKHVVLQSPVVAHHETIDPLFGNFGLRYHPVVKKPNYFHAGLDMTVPPKTVVHPLLHGVLEYAGFSIINGNYVMMSHKQVVTEDGFVFTTSVMHLKECLVGFSSYQKMLREISLHTYPEIVLSTTTPIGKTGNTGMIDAYHSHVHIQCEMRNTKTNESVLLDPAQLLEFPSRVNISASCQTQEDFQALYSVHTETISSFQLERYWKAS